MHKKQAKKTAKNQVGVYKNTPLATQTSYEEFEDFLKKYLDISSPGKLFDLLDHRELPYSCKCSVTEEMLIDSVNRQTPAGNILDMLKIMLYYYSTLTPLYTIPQIPGVRSENKYHWRHIGKDDTNDMFLEAVQNMPLKALSKEVR